MKKRKNPKRGEIWQVRFHPQVGQEITKNRPAIVVNNPLFGKLELRIVIPITNWQEEFAEYDWMVKIKPDYANGLSFCSAADAFQIKNVSINRFEHKLGRLGARQLEDVLSAIVICIGYI